MASWPPDPKQPIPVATEKPPGERLASYFENFFKTITAICTLGASLTFSKLLSPPVQPWNDYGIDAISVQSYISLSWLLFVLGLAFTAFSATIFSLYRPQAVRYFGTKKTRERQIVIWYATICSALLFGLVVAAFLFLGLVVVAYAGPVGWVAIGFTGVFGVLGFGTMIYQSPLFMGLEEQEKLRHKHRLVAPESLTTSPVETFRPNRQGLDGPDERRRVGEQRHGYITSWDGATPESNSLNGDAVHPRRAGDRRDTMATLTSPRTGRYSKADDFDVFEKEWQHNIP